MIIVNHQFKVLYILNPKVASGSIKTAFLRLLGLDVQPNCRSELLKARSKHSPLDVIKSHLEGYSSYPDYLKFTFVRNPWDRLISCYSDKFGNFIKHTGDIDPLFKRAFGFSRETTFEEFALAVCDIADGYSNIHFASQHYECLLNNRLDLLDFIGRFETIENDWNELKQRMPTEAAALVGDLVLRHKTVHEHYSAYYSPELRDKVAKRYKDDIKLFGYDFEEKK